MFGHLLGRLAGQFLELAVKERPEAAVDLAIARFHAAGPTDALRALDAAGGCARDADCLLMKALILEAAGQKAEASAAVTASLGYPVISGKWICMKRRDETLFGRPRYEAT
jgi:hypothetical protein